MSEEISVVQKDGLVISIGDTSDNRVVINGIEITTVEDWYRVINSLNDLQQENDKYKNKLDNKIELEKQFYKLILHLYENNMIDAEIERLRNILESCDENE